MVQSANQFFKVSVEKFRMPLCYGPQGICIFWTY